MGGGGEWAPPALTGDWCGKTAAWLLGDDGVDTDDDDFGSSSSCMVKSKAAGLTFVAELWCAVTKTGAGIGGGAVEWAADDDDADEVNQLRSKGFDGAAATAAATGTTEAGEPLTSGSVVVVVDVVIVLVVVWIVLFEFALKFGELLVAVLLVQLAKSSSTISAM